MTSDDPLGKTLGEEPCLVEYLDGEEILGHDMCKDRAINWGRGKPILQPVTLAMAQHQPSESAQGGQRTDKQRMPPHASQMSKNGKQ